MTVPVSPMATAIALVAVILVCLQIGAFASFEALRWFAVLVLLAISGLVVRWLLS